MKNESIRSRASVASFAMLLLVSLLQVSSVHPVLAQNADELVVVLNTRNPTRALTRAQLQGLFLGTSSFWHGVVPVRVIVRPASSGAGRKLLTVLGVNNASFNERWQVRQLAGQGVAPRTAGSPTDVVSQVRQAPGAIGVVLRSEAEALGAADGVRLIPVN